MFVANYDVCRLSGLSQYPPDSLVSKLGEEELLILCPFYISSLLYSPNIFLFTIPTFSSLQSQYFPRYNPNIFLFTIPIFSSLQSQYFPLYNTNIFIFTIPTFSCFPPFSFSVMYLYFFLLYYILPPVILFISSFSSHFLSSLSIFHFCYYNVFYLIFFSMKSFCFPLSKFTPFCAQLFPGLFQ